MAKITIYLPDDVERKARKAAKRNRMSVSRWVAGEVKRQLDDSWAPEFLAAAGACPDFPDLVEIRGGYGQDAPRESLD
ncbi:MAG TPA: hypothetical protein VKB88_30845 [Bryobacteraceae bacterium]|nr:hypothetical protein [Bryobacteraceae bacterium]